MRIRLRLLIAVASVCLVLIVSTVSLLALRSIAARSETALDVTADMRIEIGRFRYLTDELLFAEDFAQVFALWKQSSEATAQLITALPSNKAVVSFLVTEEESKQLSSIAAIWELAIEKVASVSRYGQAFLDEKPTSTIARYALESRSLNAFNLLSDSQALVVTLDTYLEKSLGTISQAAHDHSAAASLSLTRICLAVSAASGLFAAFLIFRFALTFGLSLAGFEKAIAGWDAGDFSVVCAVSGKDELAELGGMLNGMVGQFGRVIEGIAHGAATADEVRIKLQSSADEASAALEEIRASVGSIGERVDGMVGSLESASGAAASIGGRRRVARREARRAVLGGGRRERSGAGYERRGQGGRGNRLGPAGGIGQARGARVDRARALLRDEYPYSQDGRGRRPHHGGGLDNQRDRRADRPPGHERSHRGGSRGRGGAGLRGRR